MFRGFFLLCCLQCWHIFSVEIVSLGNACNVARAARNNQLRTCAYPFDWLISSLDSVFKAFEDKFKNMFDENFLHTNKDETAVIDYYGLIHMHDFPTERFPVAPEDGEIMPVHKLLKTWKESIDIVKAKFNRRVQRLLEMLNNGEPIAFVRYGDIDKDDAKLFIKMLKTEFPACKVLLAVIGSDESFKEDWGLAHVFNFYISKDQISHWDGSEWKDVIIKISNLKPKFLNNKKSKELYTLTWPNYDPGFFSAFNMVLGALDLYDKGLISGLFVNFEDKGWYYDKKRGENWWNYYCGPICVHKSDKKNKYFEKKFPTYKKIQFAYYAQYEMAQERANYLISKYIKVRESILNKVDDFYNVFFKDTFTIGVHYRGTDKNSSYVETVSYETVTEEINKLIAKNSHLKIKIFVATDDSNFAKYIKTVFGDMAIMYDSIRSDNSEGIHIRKDLDAFQKGEDAIIDCLLLSKCSTLIKTASNLSDSSLQFNPKLPVFRLNKSYCE